MKQKDYTWDQFIAEEKEKSYFQRLTNFLKVERKEHKIFPLMDQVFNAFQLTPFVETKVVILGQDPYHGEGQAHGLAFSVNKKVIVPPSLQNIFKELKGDLGIATPSHGNLISWAKQGVLLLNNSLTVREGQAASHRDQGWEQFTDQAIIQLSEKRDNLVFILWGRHAQSKKPLINFKKHLILQASHPSPLSAYRGFFGCKHFSQTNQYLQDHDQTAINWKIDETS